MRKAGPLRLLISFSLLSLHLGCVSASLHPCANAGQPPHDDGKPGKGTKQCVQQKDPSGQYVNHGKYVEWYPNGVRAIEGEYASGAKTGKWTEWDDKGRKISEKWYENGAEVPGREVQPNNGLRLLNPASTTR